jgi:hypothetical protein
LEGDSMLPEVAVRDAEPREKTYKLFDTGGLFVMVNPDGSRWWRLKYKYGEKERGISLGTYPLVSLKLARQKRDDAKRMLQDGPGSEPSAAGAAGFADGDVRADRAGVAGAAVEEARSGHHL